MDYRLTPRCAIWAPTATATADDLRDNWHYWANKFDEVQHEFSQERTNAALRFMLRVANMKRQWAYQRLTDKLAPTWRHDAPVNPFFAGAEPPRCGEDY